jgi:hypothetical protein
MVLHPVTVSAVSTANPASFHRLIMVAPQKKGVRHARGEKARPDPATDGASGGQIAIRDEQTTMPKMGSTRTKLFLALAAAENLVILPRDRSPSP